MLVANFDRGLIDAHVAALLEDETRPRSLQTSIDFATPEATSLLRYLRFFWKELQQPSSALHAPRVTREAEDMLAALLVQAWRPEVPGRRQAAPSADSLRRAEEFLAAHLEEPVSLAEVARAAGLSVRSLSRAFQQKHRQGPIGFLRRRRLEAARRDLRAAERGETTVTEVAVRYGFTHLSHFAGAYLEAFGESPSETLYFPAGPGSGGGV